MAKIATLRALAIGVLIGPVVLYYALLAVLALALQRISFSYAAAMWIVAGVCVTQAIAQGYTANRYYTAGATALSDILDFFACVTFWSAVMVVAYNVFAVWLNWHKVAAIFESAAAAIFAKSAYDFFHPAHWVVYQALMKAGVKPERAQECSQPKHS